MAARADRYRVALAELEEQRADYVNQINDLDAIIAGIKRQIVALEGDQVVRAYAIASKTSARPAQVSPETSPDEFKGMSVRWGILKFFGERPDGFTATTAEIAQALETGGYETKGQRFVGNVSAVISSMKDKAGPEIASENGVCRLTDVGRQVWEGIRRSPRYANRLTSSAQPLLS
jgi:hypothetical protein